MTLQEYNQLAAEALSHVNDQAALSETLTKMTAGFTAAENDRLTAVEASQQAEAENKRLTAANMSLFLQIHTTNEQDAEKPASDTEFDRFLRGETRLNLKG